MYKNNEIKYIIDNIIKNKTKSNEIEYYDTILKEIEELFTSENYDTTDVDNGKDDIIQTEKMNITLTTTYNQKNNNNMTSIDLIKCEILLRYFYNLTNNETIYI